MFRFFSFNSITVNCFLILLEDNSHLSLIYVRFRLYIMSFIYLLNSYCKLIFLNHFHKTLVNQRVSRWLRFFAFNYLLALSFKSCSSAKQDHKTTVKFAIGFSSSWNVLHDLPALNHRAMIQCFMDL